MEKIDILRREISAHFEIGRLFTWFEIAKKLGRSVVNTRPLFKELEKQGDIELIQKSEWIDLSVWRRAK